MQVCQLLYYTFTTRMFVRVCVCVSAVRCKVICPRIVSPVLKPSLLPCVRNFFEHGPDLHESTNRTEQNGQQDQLLGSHANPLGHAAKGIGMAT